MAAIANQKNFEWTKAKFNYVLSDSNREKLTNEVVKRLVQHNATKIFYSDLLEKVARGIANVLVDTAYREIELSKKTGKSYDSVGLKRQFYTNPQIKEICNMNGLMFGKQMVYALNNMFEKFEGNQKRILEVLKYINIRREDEGVEHDIFSILRISNETTPQIMHLESSSARRLIVEEILSENKTLEKISKEAEENDQLDLEELLKIDPEYVHANLFNKN